MPSSAQTLKLLKGEVKNIDYLSTVVPVKRCDILRKRSVLEIDVLEAGKRGKHKDLNHCDKDQTVMSSTNQKFSKDGQPMSMRQCPGDPRVIHVRYYSTRLKK